MLKVLDELEEHPHFYRRTAVSCVMDDNTSTCTDFSTAKTTGSIACEVYMMFNFHPELLSLPHLSGYINSPEQPHVPRADRDDEGPKCWWWDLKADQ